MSDEERFTMITVLLPDKTDRLVPPLPPGSIIAVELVTADELRSSGEMGLRGTSAGFAIHRAVKAGRFEPVKP